MSLNVTSNEPLSQVAPPNLPLAPTEYTTQYVDQLNNVLRLYFTQLNKIVGQLKDVAYQSKTPDFWASMRQLGGASTYLLGGALNCGKGQPGQVAPVSHGCPSATFTKINVLNTRDESAK